MMASDRVQEVADSDREDGEVSEAEVASQPSAGQANVRALPEPPRSVPQAKQASPQVEEGYNPDRPAAGQMAVKEPIHKAPRPAMAPNPVETLQQDRDQAKQFIKLLHSNNVGYSTLAKEISDRGQLQGLYQSLNLPSEPAPILPPKEAVTTSTVPPQPSATPTIQQPKPAPTIKTNIRAVPPPNPVPSPVDRKDYIARLQAAKLAKQAAAAKPSPPQMTPTVAVALPAPPVKTSQATTTPTAKPPVTAEQRARTTELIKQRLEAMKAKQQPTPVVNGSASASSLPQRPETSRPAIGNTAQQTTSGTTTPNNQSYTSPFPGIPGIPGIPGLFMNPPPSFNSNSNGRPSVPQKRPAPSDHTEVSTPRGSVTPYTRPLGDSPHSYPEEPMIIEVSDDESNGSDMDIDDDQGHSKSAVASPPTNNQRQFPGAIPDFPSRPTSVLPGSSAVSTPGPQTPATQAREKELKKKEDELAAMRLTLKRKLAEKREKDKAAAAAAASSPAPQNASAGGLPPRNGIDTELQASVTGQVQPSRDESARVSDNAMNDASDLIRDVKRRRREEIQSKLPSFDAELANNTNRMAQLMKEMELLKTQSEKITEDKERLTRELESLGVDTEGMSHAEMRAKKDEIDHEMSPEPETTTQSADNAIPAADASANASTIPIREAQQDAVGMEVASEAATLPVKNNTAEQQSFLPGLGYGLQYQANGAMAPSQVTPVDEMTTANAATGVISGAQPSQDVPASLEDASASVNTAAMSGAQGFATPLDEEDDFYSPAPAAEPAPGVNLGRPSPVQSYPEARAVDDQSLSEEGEVEMSVSSDDEEEYEPEEPTVITETPIQDAQIPKAEATTFVTSRDLAIEDEEAYEPPDVDEDMSDAQADHQTADVDVSAPEVEAEDGEMDIASSSSEDSDSDSDSDSDGETSSGSGNDGTTTASHTLQQIANVADDLAPELQPGYAIAIAPEPVRPPFVTKPS
jgi:archaellum component FlaC